MVCIFLVTDHAVVERKGKDWLLLPDQILSVNNSAGRDGLSFPESASVALSVCMFSGSTFQKLSSKNFKSIDKPRTSCATF
jgi:hypothetical protein